MSTKALYAFLNYSYHLYIGEPIQRRTETKNQGDMAMNAHVANAPMAHKRTKLFDKERIERSLKSKTHTIPAGLSMEEMDAMLMSHAKKVG
ncbi:hypothetical protein H4O21_04660 [Oceanospirillum sp. D5]|uniref:Uncharacterized protein n=2 Tax=Oceanospirillum sediminis TaxID=2760088 RepID=A0A839IMH7_9GAMM|nr:hypothetical protein [Oceanospirillum sediminis]